ncbi:MAG: cache domain-containing protein, partial [bacterium]|nr:cache domain-containing protein [bacterium]
MNIRRTFRPFRSRSFEQPPVKQGELVKWGLRSKLIMAFVTVAVLPIVFLGGRSISNQRNLIQQQVFERNLALAEIISREIDNTLRSATRLLETIVTIPRVRVMDIEETQSILDKLVTRITEKNVYRALCLVDHRGRPIINAGAFSTSELALNWYLGVVQGTHLGYESPVHMVTNTNIPVVSVVRIVRDNLYGVSGVLVGDIDLSFLEDVVNLVHLEKSGYAYLVDEIGRIILTGRPREIPRLKLENVGEPARFEEAEKLFSEAERHLAREEVEIAVDMLNKAIELNPSESKYESTLAEGYLQEIDSRGNAAYLDALVALENAVAKNPSTYKGLEVEEAVIARRIRSMIDWRPLNTAVRKVLFTGKGMEEYRDYRGINQMAVFASTKQFGGGRRHNWGVIVQQTASEAFKPVRVMMWRVVTTTGLAAMLAIGVGVLLALSITGPLAKLVKAAQTVSAGDLNQEINIQTRDELAELADNFNLMRENLRDRMEELNILYRVGQTMSSELDYEKLLYLILEEVIQVMGAEKGSLMLLDEDTGKLGIRVAKGLKEDIVKGTRVAPGEGIVGQVVQARKAILVENTLEEPGFRALKGRDIEPGTLLSVPLM